MNGGKSPQPAFIPVDHPRELSKVARNCTIPPGDLNASIFVGSE